MPRCWPHPGSRRCSRAPCARIWMDRRCAMGDLLQHGTLPGTFPGLDQRVHGAPLAYLDNAATTHMPSPVLAAMREFEARSRANIHRGVHTLSERATAAFEDARATLKRFTGA